MFKRHLTGSDYFIIAANLVPLYGVLFMDWQPGTMFLVYCLETVIIGIFNVLKMSLVTIFNEQTDHSISLGDKRYVTGWPLILFFIVHYGFFVFIQTQMFFHVSNFLNDDSFIVGYSKVIGLLGNEGRLVLLIFILSYTLQTLYSFGLSGQYKNISMGRLMFQPYTRIFVQQFVVIVGSMFMALGAGKVFMIIFVAVKIIFEIYINFDKYLQVAEAKALKDRY